MNSKELEKILSKDELYELYVRQKISAYRIAKQYNVTFATLRYLMEKYRIKTSDRIERSTRVVPLDYDKLYNLYIVEKKSKREIADIFNTSPATVNSNLKFYNIKNRNDNYINNVTLVEMIKLYEEEFCSIRDIAKKYNIAYNAVRKALLDNDVTFRDKSMSQIHYNSEENIDVSSFNNNSLVSKLKASIKNYVFNINRRVKKNATNCSVCGKTGSLHIHHIKPLNIILRQIIKDNPNKELNELIEIAINSFEINDINNLIAVCPHCHYTVFHPYLQYHDNQHPSLINEEGSTTIPKGSTPQANGSGSA